MMSIPGIGCPAAATSAVPPASLASPPDMALPPPGPPPGGKGSPGQRRGARDRAESRHRPALVLPELDVDAGDGLARHGGLVGAAVDLDPLLLDRPLLLIAMSAAPPSSALAGAGLVGPPSFEAGAAAACLMFDLVVLMPPTAMPAPGSSPPSVLGGAAMVAPRTFSAGASGPEPSVAAAALCRGMFDRVVLIEPSAAPVSRGASSSPGGFSPMNRDSQGALASQSHCLSRPPLPGRPPGPLVRFVKRTRPPRSLLFQKTVSSPARRPSPGWPQGPLAVL